ncbi:MAG: phosphoglucomutase (alpha-D-glucose-1,6-bisphosphate-dependent) [candidate division KSB1 bacterium]|nr:phosphoglucomutase (alpha-D-glucose-1,6-bisphosphate-dependent) [candidate division KSB1 bacterium]
MSIHEQAGQPVPPELRVDIPALISSYYGQTPDVYRPGEQVSFGTSGHRGTSNTSFNEHHILAVAQAICDYRRQNRITGPIYLGKDTHALSEPAFRSVLEVLTGNRLTVNVDENLGFTPTPVVSHAILTWNRQHDDKADGIIITPSHNPPDNGGIKYNPPSGGPADTGITAWIAERANAILDGNMSRVRRIPYSAALRSSDVQFIDYISAYVDDLETILDLDAIRSAGLSLCADALGGSGIAYWQPIAERYHLNIEERNGHYDPSFQFMTLDHDGKIRMDCSSPYAMAGLLSLKDQYDIAFGNDPDFDRHGIVTRQSGLLNPNHYLSVAVWYLFQNRPQWHKDVKVGKTLVSSSMIDRVAGHLGREVKEVPVGFKWFVDDLLDGTCGFSGEESAGASFLRKDGSVWTTDKDGFILALLSAEIMAKTDKDPGDIYQDLTREFGAPMYARIESPANAEQKSRMKQLSPDAITEKELAGDPIENILTRAPGNDAPIGGLKVVTRNGWFAARPSGTEDINKIYMESFKGETHLQQLKQDAEHIIANALAKAPGLSVKF